MLQIELKLLFVSSLNVALKIFMARYVGAYLSSQYSIDRWLSMGLKPDWSMV